MSNGVTNIDSVTKYYEYVEKAKSVGMTTLAFSEHGSFFEWVHKKEAIEKAGMKYVHASEFYLTETLATNVRDNYHCVLIAKNYDGVKELNKLSSVSFNKKDGHFYYVPRISFDELFATSDNVIVTTACLGGVLFSGTSDTKEKYLQFLIQNRHRCYLEIQHHNCDEQRNYNKYLANLSEKYDIPLIAATDTHALNDRHILGRSVMQKSKGVHFDNENAWDLSFKTYDELVLAYEKQSSLGKDDYLKAIENTNVLADSIESFELDRSAKYPKLYDDSMAVLKEKIVKGIKVRGINKYPNFNDYKKKIAYELETYKYNGAIDYMLLEENYKSALKKQGISFGYSRGSVSGSVVAYVLGITEVDSIKYDLNFERFMNKERISLADIDSDWFKEDRDKVREYLFNKKGLYCCDIITFNTIALKGAIKDVGRALGLPIETTQEMSDAVYQDENKKFCIDKKYKEQYPELFDYVDIVTGTIVSVGSHPAGLVVSPHAVDDAFGTFYTSTNANPVSQINMKEIDGLNYVKLDVLGLDCVGLINKTCDAVGIKRLTPDNMNMEDENVWNDLKQDCTLIFQFESDSAGAYLRNILSDSTLSKIKERNPNASYIDLMSMANGAIRPAGASYRDELSQGIYHDNGHEALNEFLAPTLGYLVYQEQVIEFLHSFCGYTMGEADIVRRGFAKKSGTEKFIPKIKSGFIETMNEKYGVSQETSEVIIESFLKVIEDASSYLFSKNHADPYSFLGYACAYLRHYYPLEFFTVALNIYKEDAEKTVKIKDYIKSKSVEIKNIEYGHSRAEYWFDKNDNCIYQGIASIKYCNSNIANELIELSKTKRDNFIDLVNEIKTNTSVDTRQLNILTTLDFFKQYGKNKRLLEIIELYDKFYGRKQIKKTDIETLNINIDTFLRYAKTETAKMYKDIDMLGFIGEVSKNIDDKALPVRQQIKSEVEFLETPVYINPKAPANIFIVTAYKTYSSATKPYVTLYELRTGNSINTKVKDGKMFTERPFELYSCLAVWFKDQNKMRRVDGKWVRTDEKEKVMSDWEVY